MPLIKSAIKKVRKDETRTARNRKRKGAIERASKQVRREPSLQTLGAFFSNVDKAVKTKLIHKNKAARLKSQFSKLVASK